jgi:predicted MPP superfamily phosphohydrolase
MMWHNKTMTQPPDDNLPPSPRRRFLTRLFGLGLLGLGATACSQWDEADRLSVTHIRLGLPDWPVTAPPLTVGFLADMHCYNKESAARTRRAVSMLLAQKPDVVILGGDYITKDPPRWAPVAAEALAPLGSVPGGVFCILGNHDWTDRLWLAAGADIVTSALCEVGFHVLRNASAPLSAAPGVWVVGLDDRYAQQQNVALALRQVPSDACKLLLVHEPDYADEAPPGFAFQLSGHSHGGQIRLPLLPPLHVPKYSSHYPEGLRQGPHHPVYTTRGVGTTGPPVRLFCPPEVTVFHLHGA